MAAKGESRFGYVPVTDLAMRSGFYLTGAGWELIAPHDVAKAILFFSGDESSGITGTSLVIDCGYLTAAEWDTETFKHLRGVSSPDRRAAYESDEMTMPRGPREVVR